MNGVQVNQLPTGIATPAYQRTTTNQPALLHQRTGRTTTNQPALLTSVPASPVVVGANRSIRVFVFIGLGEGEWPVR